MVESDQRSQLLHKNNQTGSFIVWCYRTANLSWRTTSVMIMHGQLYIIYIVHDMYSNQQNVWHAMPGHRNIVVSSILSRSRGYRGLLIIIPRPWQQRSRLIPVGPRILVYYTHMVDAYQVLVLSYPICYLHGYVVQSLYLSTLVTTNFARPLLFLHSQKSVATRGCIDLLPTSAMHSNQLQLHAQATPTHTVVLCLSYLVLEDSPCRVQAVCGLAFPLSVLTIKLFQVHSSRIYCRWSLSGHQCSCKFHL